MAIAIAIGRERACKDLGRRVFFVCLFSFYVEHFFPLLIRFDSSLFFLSFLTSSAKGRFFPPFFFNSVSILFIYTTFCRLNTDTVCSKSIPSLTLSHDLRMNHALMTLVLKLHGYNVQLSLNYLPGAAAALQTPCTHSTLPSPLAPPLAIHPA